MLIAYGNGGVTWECTVSHVLDAKGAPGLNRAIDVPL